jgi:hypothetical protein
VRKASGTEAHDPVPDGEPLDRGADLEHHPRPLGTERRLARVEVEGDQDVAEIDPDGGDRDADLVRLKRRVGGRELDQRDLLDRVAARLEAPVPDPVGRRDPTRTLERRAARTQ